MPAGELILRVCAWTVSALCIGVAAYLIHRSLRFHSLALAAIAFTSLLIALTTLMMLLAGLAGLIHASSLALISLSGLGLMLAIPNLRQALGELPAATVRAFSRVQHLWLTLPRWMRAFTAFAAALSILRFVFLIWALPPFVWDSLTYHLTNVAHWTQAGRIELFETPVARIYTPANYEALAAWFTVFLHHDALVEAAGLPAYLLALLSVYSMVRTLGGSQSNALLGALAYGMTPALLLAVTGTKNDPHMAAYFLAAAAIILDLSLRAGELNESQAISCLLLLALVLGLAAGTKAYLIHLTPGLVVLGLACAKPAWRLSAWGRVIRSAVRGILRLSVMAKLGVAALLSACLLLAGYWNIRNWVLTGNPFYPYRLSIQGAQVLNQGERTARLTTDRLVANVDSLLSRFGDSAGPIQPDLPETTGWGWFFYGLGLMAILWALIRRGRFRMIMLSFTISLLLLMLSIRPSPWNLRYVIWYPAIAALAFSLWLDAVPLRPSILGRSFIILMILTSSLNFLMTINYGRVSLEKFELMLERSLWSRDAAVLKLNMPEEYENALVHVPKDELLGYNVREDGFVYPLYRADFSQRIAYIPLSGEDSCQAIAERARSAGIAYLFAARGHSDDAVIARLDQCSEAGGRIRQQAKGVYLVGEDA